eukprot:1184242-Prorocentrum_minimum.AAC.1
MVTLMEELQEELSDSMDPTMQTLTNMREVNPLRRRCTPPHGHITALLACAARPAPPLPPAPPFLPFSLPPPFSFLSQAFPRERCAGRQGP